MTDTAQELEQTQSLSEAEQEFVRAAMAKVGQDLIGALWELPGFEHTKGNSVVEDVLDLARRLRARQREEGGGLERIEVRLDELEEYARDDVFQRMYNEAYQHGFLRALRHVRQELDAMDATPQREGEREPESDDLGRTPMESLRDHAREVANEIDEWGDVAPPHIHALIEVAKRALYTEPPAMREPDLDELAPRCPACRETMHDCECNPYMDTEDAESITMECSQCQAAVEVPIEGDLLRIGTHATGWTITRNGRIICPSHPASATPDTEKDDGR